MKVVMQRVTRAMVTVEHEVVGAIGPGLLLLAGIGAHDDVAVARRMAQKCAEMRIFGDGHARFSRSLLDTGGEALVVSQFTLLADTRRGRRPSFTAAAPPEIAAPLVEHFADKLRDLGVRVSCGQFGADMQVESVNDGPVTIVLDSADIAND